MRIAKRVFLFLTVNVLIMVTISLVLNLLGVQPYLTAKGIDYSSLAIFCLLWGFGGAFISLALSKVMAKWMMGVKILDPKTVSGANDRWLIQTVHQLAAKAGLQKMPEVGIYESEELNAFATGPTKNRSLVAVSTGLLDRMDRGEVEGVLGHEIAHIANGDMVTMTLVQGVVNAFVMFFARILAFAVSQLVDEEKRHWVHLIAVIAFEIVFSILGMFVVAYYSRRREFRADAGGARLTGRDKMAAALMALQRTYEPHSANNAFETMKISGNQPKSLMSFLSTHPPLSERIKRLQAA